MSNPYNLGLAAWLGGDEYNVSPGIAPVLVSLGGIGRSVSNASIIYQQLQLEALADVLDAILIALGGSSTPNSLFRDTALTLPVGDLATTISAAPCSVYGMNVYNPNVNPVFVKFYNKPGATVGTDTPVTTIAIPPAGAQYIAVTTPPQYSFSTGCSVSVTQSVGDGATDAPATAIYIDVTYR